MGRVRLSWAIASLLLAGAIVPVESQIPAAYGSTVDRYTLTKVADGIYAFFAPDSRTPFVTSNSLAVIGRDGVLVVDSGHVPPLTRRMIADIRTLTDKPVKYVVNTHWHQDHVVGNGEYLAAFPNVTIVSTAATQAQMEDHLPSYVATLGTQLPTGVERLRETLKTGRKADGSSLSAGDREFYEAEIHDFEAAWPAVKQMTYAPPTLTFEGDLTVDLGRRKVRILFLGKGNTAGDAVVYVPDSKVVATGDLVVAPVPYATASFMFDWPKTMNRLMALEATAIIPGHGPLMHDWSYAKKVTELLSAVDDQVSKAVAEGLSLEDTRKRLDLAAFRSQLAGNDPFQGRIFDVFFVPGAVERAYREAMFNAEK